MPKSAFFLWRSTFLIAVQVTILFLAQPAQSGGGDSESVDSESENKPKVINATANIKWEKWSQPYWLSNQVCRDKAGDTVCFSSETAIKMGWNIPERN